MGSWAQTMHNLYAVHTEIAPNMPIPNLYSLVPKL